MSLSEKIKVVHIWKDLDTFYGIHDQLLSLGSLIDKQTFEMSLCVFCGNSHALEDKFKDLGIEVYNLETRWHNPLILWRLRSFLKRVKPDIVQTYVLNTNIFGRIAALLAKVPVIIGTELTLKDQVSSKVKRLRDIVLYPLNYGLNSFSDCLVFVSEAVKREWVGRKESQRWRIIYSPFNLHKFEDWRASDGSPSRKGSGRVIGIVSRLSEEKGIVDLVDCLPRVLKTFPETKLLIVGTGPCETALKQEVHRLELGDHVIFSGYRDNVFEELSKMDLFVFPSRSEGMGIAIVEAMVMGLPVVATRVGGIPEVVVDGETGILVPPQDVEQLAEAIIGVLSHPEKARRMGMLGRDRAFLVFHPLVFTRNHESLYRELIEKKKAIRPCMT